MLEVRLCSGPAAVARAIDFRKYHAERKAKVNERKAQDKEWDEAMERSRAITEQLREGTRRLRIDNGLPVDPPRKSTEQIRAETIVMRAENDQLLAERDGAWRTYD